MRVWPNFFPKSPIGICSNFNRNIHSGRKVELLQLVHRLGGRFDNIDQPLVRALLERLLGFLVRVRGSLNGETLDAGREWDRSGDTGPRALDGVGDVAGGLVDDAMVKGLQSDTNALSSHRKNNFILMVWL